MSVNGERMASWRGNGCGVMEDKEMPSAVSTSSLRFIAFSQMIRQGTKGRYASFSQAEGS